MFLRFEKEYKIWKRYKSQDEYEEQESLDGKTNRTDL